ncbi:MAG: hypothetical protein ABIR11_14080 [Candidatus Limnocylindrales bacterium]
MPDTKPLVAGVFPGEGGSGPGGAGGASGSSGSGGADGGSGFSGSGGQAGLPGGLGGPTSLLATVARILPTAVVTTGGVTMAMAFLVFGKRRRDEMPTAPDDVLAANAARGAGLVPNASYAGSVAPDAAAVATAVQAVAVPMGGAGEIDAHMPRWRRPSLIEARKADPTRGGGAAAVRLTFTGDAGAAVDGLERRLIRYRLVSLLDAPDEIRGVEIGTLDEGDEVVLMEKRGTYWRVLCPDGRQGWVHKMVLGDVVIDPSTQAGASWTSGDDGPMVGGFEDVLRAYTERRQQFGEAT